MKVIRTLKNLFFRLNGMMSLSPVLEYEVMTIRDLTSWIKVNNIINSCETRDHLVVAIGMYRVHSRPFRQGKEFSIHEVYRTRMHRNLEYKCKALGLDYEVIDNIFYIGDYE